MRPCFNLVFALLLLLSLNCVQAQEKLFSNAAYFNAGAKSIVTKGTKFKLDRIILKKIFSNKSRNVRIEIQIENKTCVLNLNRKQLFSKNFEVVLSGSLETYLYMPGYYLQGKIEGQPNSFAAISIFNDFVAGIISYKGNNYNLVPANNHQDYTDSNYILYADKDYQAPGPACFTRDDDTPQTLNLTAPLTSSFVGCPLDIYFETGYKLFQNLGSVQNVMNYFTILFNAEQALYNNENIVVQIRQVKVWTTADPEIGYTEMYSTLGSFANRMDISGFNGDIAQYVTFADLGGGAAFRDELCSTAFGRSSVCGNLAPAYSPYPNYSFSVTVMSHEAGHTIGSPHTHSCTWPGGPIDNCVPVDDGPCAPGPAPVNGGTIMSYCHLVSAGINFANGFGPLPGNLLRMKLANAALTGCTCNCANLQLDVTKQNINCTHASGNATAVVTNGNGPFTYSWSNGASGASVAGLAAGTYYVTVTGSSQICKVVKGFKILDSSVHISLTPATSSVTKCVNQSYNISASILSVSGGVYTYQWYKNAVAVAGATANSLSVTSPVAATLSYYVVATKGTCIVQSATVVVNFVAISIPVIDMSGSPNICEGQSIVLSIPQSTFFTEWQLNGTAVPGATSSSYMVSTAGSYRVRNFYPSAGGCSVLSAPVTITILPLPDASVNTASIALCAGDHGTITHPALAGETYTWYKNNVLLSGETGAALDVNTAGNYSIHVRGANGCYHSGAGTSVIVNPLPVAVLTPSGTVALCEGGTLAVYATEAAQYQYTWYESMHELSSVSGNILSVTVAGSYSVKIINSLTGCINTSASTLVTSYLPPAILASNDTIIATGQPYMLSVHGITTTPVDHFEWQPATGLNNPNSSHPVTTLLHDQEYLVKGFYPSGCFAIDRVYIRVLNGPALYVPAAFSPNDDNRNDVLNCIAVGISSFKYFDIFNRYGQKIFHTSTLSTGWDGKWNGIKLGVGTYVYIAEGTDLSGKPVIAKGTVTILF